jgi:hypothetical protein
MAETQRQQAEQERGEDGVRAAGDRRRRRAAGQ